MKLPLFIKYVIPFVQWYVFMILSAIGLDYFLHYFQIVFIGRHLGYIGTFFILISFIYSLRKRKIIQSGSPKHLLRSHEYLSWAGSIMLLVHAGKHFNAIVPWLAIVALLINVASGLVGKFLLKKSNISLNERRLALTHEGLNKEDIDKKLFFDSLTVDAMKKWRTIHLHITALLLILSMIHIITILMFIK